MPRLKSLLLHALEGIEGLEHRPSPVPGGSALFFRGREFAHFHDDHELDLRLTARVIRAEGLSHPPDSAIHPGRSPRSPWIELRFRDAAQAREVARLVRLAIEAL